MAIDNPLEAFDQQNMQDAPDLPNKIAKFVGSMGAKLILPDGGFALDILLKVLESLFDKDSTKERVTQMWELVKSEFEHVETTKADHGDVQRAIQLAFAYDWRERNDKKRERYAKLIGNALRSEEQIQDVASFIQTIEQLNERDVAVLKVINMVMNKEGDWKSQMNSATGNVMKNHPNTFIQRAQELTVQIAMALGQSIETNQYTREIGYGVCCRLQGFGLAHEIDVQPRELPLTNYSFRLNRRTDAAETAWRKSSQLRLLLQRCATRLDMKN
jgi:hypothetical protein